MQTRISLTDVEIRQLFRLPHQIRLLTITLFLSLGLSSCVSSINPTLREPNRLFNISDEIQIIKDNTSIDYPITTPEARNNFITLRMYAIDQNYTIYEAQLTHEAQETGLGESLINLGLTGAASVAPTAVVGKALSAAATGITGASTAYDEKILLSQSVQNLETQMRADRSAQAAVILESMRCPLESYNVGSALSDLELYYRAGTLPSALIALSKTVADAEDVAKAKKATASPASPVAAEGKATLKDKAKDLTAQSDVTNTSTDCKRGVFATEWRVAERKAPPVVVAPRRPSSKQSVRICGIPTPIYATPDACEAINKTINEARNSGQKSLDETACTYVKYQLGAEGNKSACSIN